MTLSRRALFQLLRPGAGAGAPPAPEVVLDDDPAPGAADGGPPSDPVAADPGFSLDGFYAARREAAPLPPFALRADAAGSPTTRVGLGRQDPAASLDPSQVQPLPPGLAPQVLPHRCLATTSFCSICVERCPVEGALVVARGRPSVDPARCDGCGHCIAACPAPILALAVVPRALPRAET